MSARGGDGESMTTCSDEAWNNLVLKSDPNTLPRGSAYRAASLAAMYMSLANSGGINSFLTCTAELDAEELVSALEQVGATTAASELKEVVSAIGVPLLRSSREERWELLDRHWPSEMNDIDFLSEEADSELREVLIAHVAANEAYYLGLT